MLLIGVLLFYFGAYPYVVVGKYPVLFDWSSRHQFLFPFGAALVVFSVVIIAVKESTQLIVFAILIICSVSRDTKDMLNYHVDSLKQNSIIYQLNELTEWKNSHNKVVLFDDLAHPINVMDRPYRFYEFNGCIKQAFGDQSRLGLYVRGSSRAEVLMQYVPYRDFNYHQFDRENLNIVRKVTIQTTDIDFDNKYTDKVKLVLSKLFYPATYDTFRNNFISLSFDEFGPIYM